MDLRCIQRPLTLVIPGYQGNMLVHGQKVCMPQYTKVNAKLP